MTSAQLTLDDYTAPAPAPTNYDRFFAFHSANPHILRTIIQEALCMKFAGGDKRGSVKRIVESLRWNPAFRTDTQGGEYKLNNTHVAYYARLAMDIEPRLRGFFETRGKDSE